jgi:hypothetical protein
MDGVYEQQPDGSLLFHPLPAPSDEDIAGGGSCAGRSRAAWGGSRGKNKISS